MISYRLRLPATAFLGALMLVSFAGGAFAQEESPPQVATGQRGTGFVFDLGPAGARSLGMGGAFIGSADDATAAVRNPAGLTQLAAPHLSANLRFTKVENPAAVDFSGASATFEDSVTAPTYLGYTHPFENAAIAVFFEQSVKNRFHSDFSDGNIPIEFIGIHFLVDEQVNIENSVRAFGGAVGYELGDVVAVGATVRFQSLDWMQTRVLTLTDFNSQPDSVTLDIEHEESEASDITFDFGVLVNPGGAVSGGFVYRQGAEFELQRTLTPSCSGLTGPLCSAANFTVDTHTLALPSMVGGGVKFAAEDFRVGVDVVQVRYSETQESFEFIFGFPADEPLDDAIQFHVGGEYGFGDPEEARGFLRAGVFNSPDHDGLRTVDTDRIHFTVGGGALISQTVQFDGALNIADGITEGLLSVELIFR